jgi:hypothetical protein
MLWQHDKGPELAGVGGRKLRQLRKRDDASTTAVFYNSEVVWLDTQWIHPASVYTGHGHQLSQSRRLDSTCKQFLQLQMEWWQKW